MMDDRIKVLIVDDQEKTRRALMALLKFVENINVIGEASNGEEAIAHLKENPPHVILMDLEMPVLDGIQATLRIKKIRPSVKVVAMTVFPRYREDAIAAGVDYFLIKGDPNESIQEIIQHVYSQKITRRGLNNCS